MTKYLIVNSDDFGISEGVNKGIIEAHQRGIVTSTTTMINMPAAAAAIQQAHADAPQLGIGLHLTLSFGSPVSAPESVPSLLTESGTFVSTYQDLVTKMATFSPQEVEREFHAQFDLFCEVAGRLPDHIDSHHHAAYIHPAGLDILLSLAKRHNIPLRWAGDPESAYDSNPKTLQVLRDTVHRHGQPRHCDYLINSIFDFESSPRLDRLIGALQELDTGYTELIVHVGYGKDLAEDYNFQRNEELAAITDPGLKPLLEHEGIQLCTFGDLP